MAFCKIQLTCTCKWLLHMKRCASFPNEKELKFYFNSITSFKYILKQSHFVHILAISKAFLVISWIAFHECRGPYGRDSLDEMSNSCTRLLGLDQPTHLQAGGYLCWIPLHPEGGWMEIQEWRSEISLLQMQFQTAHVLIYLENIFLYISGFGKGTFK